MAEDTQARLACGHGWKMGVAGRCMACDLETAQAALSACQEEAEEKLTHLEGMWAYERDRAETAETALSSEATKGET